MKINKNYLLSEIEGENIVITIGNVENTFNGYLKINNTSKFLWTLLQEEVSQEDLVFALEQQYSIDQKIATQDVDNFLKILRDINALEE